MSVELCLQPVLARILIIKFWGVWIPKTVWQLWPWSHLRAVQVLRYYCDAWTVVHSVLYSYNTAFMWERYDFDDEYIKSAGGTASQSSRAECSVLYILHTSVSLCVCVCCIVRLSWCYNYTAVVSVVIHCYLLEDTVSTEMTVTQCFHRQPDGAVWVLVLSGRHPFPGWRLYKMTQDGCCFFTFILCYSIFRFIGKFLLVVLVLVLSVPS